VCVGLTATEDQPAVNPAVEKQFFEKKRTKKLLRVWAEPRWRGRSKNRQEFFASLFQKRSPFFPKTNKRLSLRQKTIAL
jgi:hypothetical protein